MAVLNILKNGEKELNKISRPVEKINDRIITILDDLIETLHNTPNGCGLAAPQVGILRRLAIVEVEKGEIIELINPVIIEKSEETECDIEGCLSVPDKNGIVERPIWVKVKSLNRKGEEVIYDVSDFKARCFQHEMDHLDGILYTDIAIKMLTPEEVEEYYEE